MSVGSAVTGSHLNGQVPQSGPTTGLPELVSELFT